MKRRILIITLLLAIGAGIYVATTYQPHQIIITGIVTTDDVIVSSQILGRLQELRVKEGDEVKHGELLGVIQPQEYQADMSFYANSEQQSASQVTQAKADLQYQEEQTNNQIQQAEANLAAAQSQVSQAEADEENTRLNYEREQDLYRRGVDPKQTYDQSRTAHDGSKAHLDAMCKQREAAESAVALAKSNAQQIASRKAALDAYTHQLAAAGAQKDKAKVHLEYTEIRAPLDGTIDVRAAYQGEVVNPGQGIVTIIDPDNLWVRADVEETYIDRIHLGDKMIVRLPSGAERQGTVTFRGIDADYATQRDVSRTKRDIKTFEVRLRCDNKDRSLAVGMTAYVSLRLAKS